MIGGCCWGELLLVVAVDLVREMGAERGVLCV